MHKYRQALFFFFLTQLSLAFLNCAAIFYPQLKANGRACFRSNDKTKNLQEKHPQQKSKTKNYSIKKKYQRICSGRPFQVREESRSASTPASYLRINTVHSFPLFEGCLLLRATGALPKPSTNPAPHYITQNAKKQKSHKCERCDSRP